LNPLAEDLKQLPVIGEPESAAAEAYRTVLASILLMENGEPLKAVGVASPGPENSRIAVATNVAALMALGGARTLLVDADVRKPTVHMVYGTVSSPGLLDCLQGDDPDGLVLPTKLEHLYLLPAGWPGQVAPDVAAFKRLSGPLVRLFDSFDRVVVMLPPLLAASEALVCARWAQAVILVLEAFRTRREMAQRAKAILEAGQVRVLGAVLTNARDVMIPARY
jgi:capsular exopolysaccharide synthesis family protein